MSRPLHEADLIFPSAATAGSFAQTLTALKRDNLSITNRLHSIAHDAAFVLRVADAYGLPLVANERCGSWYIRPDRKAGSAYFKSTDGHHGQWSCSLRRLNLQVLDVISQSERKQGCIIVDSTRRGKSMPDALSKTVPIWATVFNRLLFPELPEAHDLVTPTDVVSRSEHTQIEDRISSFVTDLKSLSLDLDSLRTKLNFKPLRPVWVTPDTYLPLSIPSRDDCQLVVLCTASGRTMSSPDAPATYVQGAADDSESWACGLDAACFWKNNSLFLSTPEHELHETIKSLILDVKPLSRHPVLIRPTNSMYISDNTAAEACCHEYDVVVSCTEQHSNVIAGKLKDRYISLTCAMGKVGSRNLRNELIRLDNLADLVSDRAHPRILFACQTGKDLAVGVALAILCRLCKDNGCILQSRSNAALNKALIKQRLSWIMISSPDSSPSRATLQSVNAYLLG